jgi:hypothetical protein
LSFSFVPIFLIALPTLKVLVPEPVAPCPLFPGEDFCFLIVLLIFSTLYGDLARLLLFVDPFEPFDVNVWSSSLESSSISLSTSFSPSPGYFIRWLVIFWCPSC